jgi:dTDP-glucose 4,6-dehydratase
VNLLVTGGAGFIGTNFVKRQLDLNPLQVSKIVVLDKLTYAGRIENFSDNERKLFEFVEGDICDTTLVSRLVSKADLVVNFAAESHVDRSITDATNFIETNYVGTQVILDSCRNFGVEKFLQVSTDEVYGSINEGSWTEDFPLLPNSPYSASKAGADLLIRAYGRTYGFHTNITRCSNNFGPYQFPEKVIPLFVTNLICGEKLPIYGDGLNIRDWLHVNDHCHGIELVLQGGRKGEIYNIGGGTELTNLQLARKVLSIFGYDDSHLKFVSDRLGHDFRYSVNIKKIVSELDFIPKVKFDEGLLETIEFYKKNPKWWSGTTQRH